MIRKPNLGAEAQNYADLLSGLLNNTVCDHARVGMILRPDGVTAVVGTDLDGQTYRSRPDSDPLKDLLIAVGRPNDNLSKIHLPVGGRRFRPALEDVLEALVDERIVIGSAIWRDVLTESRDEFRRRQLKAAIRREPDVAAAALRALDYDVVEPTPTGNVRSMLNRTRRSKSKKR